MFSFGICWIDHAFTPLGRLFWGLCPLERRRTNVFMHASSMIGAEGFFWRIFFWGRAGKHRNSGPLIVGTWVGWCFQGCKLRVK